MKTNKTKKSMPYQKAAALLFALAVVTTPCFASGFANSDIAVGTKNLLSDLSTFLVVICPVAGGLAAIYFTIRKGMADEQDGKMWQKRTVTAILCGVAGALISGIIKLISGYYM